MKAHPLALGFSLAATLALTGCPGSVNQVPGSTSTGGDSLSSGTVNGQVTSSDSDASAGSYSTQSTGTGIAGAAVVAVKVEANGSLVPVSESVQADASGNFSLKVPADTANLVLKATKDNVERLVILSQKVAANAETTVKPMTTESAVEARAFAKLVASGAQASAVDTIDLMERVSAEAALQAKDSEEAIVDLATSVKNAQQTFVDSLKKQGKTEAEIAAARMAKAKAYAELSVKLKAAQTSTEAKEAYAAYRNSLADAYTNAGIAAEAQMKAAEAATMAQVRFAGNAGAQLKAAIAKEAAHQKAKARRKAADAALTALGATEISLSASANASAQLHADLDAATTLDGVKAAFATYSTTMRGVLKELLTLQNETVAVNALVNLETALATASASLSTSLDLAAAPDAALTAYDAFEKAVAAAVNAQLLPLGAAKAGAAADFQLAISANVGF
jgi:hypothetical protein